MLFAAAYGPSPDRAYNPADDLPLVACVRAADARDAHVAFAKLFERYGAALIAFARSQLGSREQAEDVVQDVFVAIWMNREGWVVRGSPRTYLYQAVRHRIANTRRDAQVRARIGIAPPDDLQGVIPAASAADTGVTDWELRRVLDNALLRLPPRNREVFILVRAQHLSHTEAAEVLGISVNAVAVHMRRALQVLREVLAEYQR